MAIVANTYLRYDAKGLRESLHDFIYDVSPEDTPFLSAAGRGDAVQTLEEWQTDALASADTANAQLEGDDVSSFSAITPTARVGNYTQISRKTFLISETEEVVDKAGRRSEMAYQVPRRGVELKIDIESICFQNIAGVAGDSTTARKAAGLPTWIQTNDDRQAAGAASGHSSGVPAATATDSPTLRAFTETILKAVVLSMYQNGANLRSLFVGPVNKQRVSGFSGIATRNFDLSNVDPRPTAAIGAIDIYVSDFGSLKVIPSRWQRERDAWFFDFEYLSLMYLRPMKVVKLAKTGDAEKRMLITEWTLKVHNEQALGLAADLTTT
jgi:hypothetical protein